MIKSHKINFALRLSDMSLQQTVWGMNTKILRMGNVTIQSVLLAEYKGLYKNINILAVFYAAGIKK